MIVQAAAPGVAADAPRFVIAQREHARVAAQLAAAWGNAAASPLEPRDLLLRLVEEHDRGWDDIDAAVGRDAATGLPWNLVSTPLPVVVASSARGPELNEREHPLIGLLSSMHAWGLYNGRYGLSDKIFVDAVPAEHRPAVDDMLAGERARQDRLRAALAADPSTAGWVADDVVMHNYQLLQLFDTLALYFNCAPDQARATARFPRVPLRRGEEATLTVTRIAPHTYQVAPYPFATSPCVITCAGRWLAPQPEGTDMTDALADAPGDVETITLVAP